MAVAGACSVVAATGYASLYDRDLASGVAATPFLLSGFLVPGALFLTVSGRRHQLDRRVSATVIVLFAALQFYLGYRSTAAMPLDRLDVAEPPRGQAVPVAGAGGLGDVAGVRSVPAGS